MELQKISKSLPFLLKIGAIKSLVTIHLDIHKE